MGIDGQAECWNLQSCGLPSHPWKQWTAHVEKDPDILSLLYSNSAMACDDSLIPRLEKGRPKFPTEIHVAAARKEFISFTGKSGLIMEAYLMECFCGEDNFNKYLQPSVYLVHVVYLSGQLWSIKPTMQKMLYIWMSSKLERPGSGDGLCGLISYSRARD